MNVAIAGYGQEGEQNYKYWLDAGHTVTIHDEKESPDCPLPEGANAVLGFEAYDDLSRYDLVIRTAGLPPRKLTSGKNVWSATNEFFEKCPAPIIGVTGTKGKGTTSSFIAGILTAAGRTVHLVGNIGVPALSRLKSIKADDIVVYELSSFQLWDVRKSPQIAVVLMIEPDHLDVHDSMEDYLSAKANIVRFQNSDDVVVFNALNELTREVIKDAPSRRVEYPDGQRIAPYESSVLLPGKHNIDNADAAVAAVAGFVTDQATIAAGLASFTGLPHRLKLVAEKAGVNYFDDSIATTPGSAIAALASFEEPKVIILGGKDKGAEYEELIETCQSVNATVIAIGANGPVIAELCREIGATCVEETGDMTAIVRRCADIAQPGSVVILSPAASSFDMFKSYSDRGDQFAAAVEAL